MFNETQLNDVKEKIELIKNKYGKTRKLVIFGAGGYSVDLYQLMVDEDIKPSVVIDNSVFLNGRPFFDLTIQLAQEYLKVYDDNNLFLIVSRYYSEMKQQIEELGYKEERHIIRVLWQEDVSIWRHHSKNDLIKICNAIERGKGVLEYLREEYGQDIQVLINPAASIGDVFLMSFYINNYQCQKKCVFLFSGNALCQLAESVGIKRVCRVSRQELEDVLLFARLVGFEKDNIKLLHTGYVYYRIWSRMLTYKGYTWMEHYRELFELPEDIEVDVPDIKTHGNIVGLLDKFNLAEKKTVIIAPYANTIKEIPFKFWIELAKALKQKGYSVCTNVGSENEEAIEGTVPIFVKVQDMKEFVERSGYFIGLRSGLCDVICQAKCQKFILYSDEIFDLISVYDFYSLEKMGFGSMTKEYIFKNDIESLIETLLNEF